MNECEVCYQLFDEKPNVLRTEVGKHQKTAIILNMCNKCMYEHKRIQSMRTQNLDISKQPFKVQLEQAILMKIAMYRWSVI